VRGSRPDVSAADVARSLLTGEFAPAEATVDHAPGEAAGRSAATSVPAGSSAVLPGSGRATYWQSVARVGVQVAEALEHAHKLGVLHRDVKPSNLLLDARGTVWVTDFGLAKADDQPNLTHTGDILGTLRYMPPEALDGRSDARSDVYSLGLTLYELLAFRPAFDEQERNRLIKQVTHEEPARLSKLNRSVPRDLETIVHKAIDREPGRRYQSAADLAADLQRFLEGEPIRARRVGALRRAALWARRRPAAAALLLVSGVAALALVGVAVSLVYSAQLADAKNKLEALQYRHYIDRAHAGLRDGNIGQVEALLEACPVEQRHWEWHYLKRQCHAELLTFKSISAVSAVDINGNVVSAVSPDGTRCAFAVKDGPVKIHDAKTGQEIRTLKSRTAPPGGIALRFFAMTYSPDGARLALACSDQTIHIWDATTGEELHILKGAINNVKMIFRPDGRRLASASWREEAVLLWDLTTGRPIPPPLKAPTESTKFSPGSVIGIAFSPDGARLAAGILEGSIHIWDVSTGRRLRSFQADSFEIWDLAFSPDGTRLASGGYDRAVKIWDVDPGRADDRVPLLLTLRGHTTWLNGVTFSPDGPRIASASVDGVIKIWAAATGEELASFAAHAGMVNRLGFSPDGTRLFSNGRGGPKVWDATTDPKARVLARHPGQSYGGELSPDGKWFVFSNFDSPDHTATVLDATTGQTVHTLLGHKDRVRSVAFSPDGTRIATASFDKTVKIWDAETGREVFTLAGHSGAVSTVAFRPDGKRLASASADRTARVWDLATRQEVLCFKDHTQGNPSVTYSPDGKRLATGAFENVAKVWDADSGEELHALEGHTWWIEQLAFSPDGKWLASASFDRTVKIWDVATGKLLRTLRGHSFFVQSVAFTPDGKRLASASRDGTVKIWDPAVEEEALLTLPFHTDVHPYVTFSPDGGQLFLATGGRAIRVFDARPLTTEILAEREALGLLDFLYALPLRQADVIEHLENSLTISPAARRRALALVKGYREETNPESYYKASWALLCQPYLNPVQYHFALRQAQTACQRDPKKGEYQTALGVALYRAGKYLEAITTLKKCDHGTPEVLAFLAMAQYRAGQHLDARKTLEQLRQTMKRPQWATQPEAQRFLREAEELLREAAREPKQ
jgi:WD40 repeat protein